MTPPSVRQAARDIGQVTDFDAKYASTLEPGQRRRRPRPAARDRIDADLLHQRREDRGRSAAAVLRSGDRVRAATRARRNDRAVHMPALATHELTKDYAVGFWRKRPYRALDRLTLEVEPGEVFGFLGPNGAGKTTTLKLLMQLVFPTSGRAEMLGRPLGDLSVKRRIGYLPENPYFYDHLTAEELLAYFAGLFGYPRRERRSRAEPSARRGRHRRRAAAAAAQVLEGHAAARRHRAGAHQRSRARDLRRADVGPRSARPPRRPRADPAAARSRLHGLLQLARLERRRGALQPRGDPRQGPPGGVRPAHRHARVPGAAAGSWSSPASSDGAHRLARRRACAAPCGSATTATRSTCRSSRRPSGCSRELTAAGAQLVSLNPIRQTLEDFFVEQVTMPERARRPTAGSIARRRERADEGDRRHRGQRVPRIGARQGALQPGRCSRCC